MSAEVKQSFIERYWQAFVIGFGLILTLFFALYSPHAPGEHEYLHGQQPTAERSASE